MLFGKKCQYCGKEYAAFKYARFPYFDDIDFANIDSVTIVNTEMTYRTEIEEEFAAAMSEKMQNIIHDYETLKFQKSAIAEKLEELQKQIIEYMSIGNVAKINCTLGTISRTADSVVESFDSAKFKKENAELYNQYLKKSTRKGSIRYTINKL